MQDLLSKLRAWGPCRRVETGKGERGRGTEKNVELNKNQQQQQQNPTVSDGLRKTLSINAG